MELQSTQGMMRARNSEWLPLLALFVVGIFPNGILLCAPALANQLVAEFAFTPAQIGNFFSLEFCGFAVAGILGTWILPRVDWTKLLKFAIFAYIVGNIASIYALPNVTAFMVIQGFTTILGGCSINLLALSFSGEVSQPARGYAMYIIGQLVSGTIGLLVLPHLFQLYGLQAYFIAAVLLALTMLPCIKWLPSTPAAVTNEKAAKPKVPFFLMLLGLGTITSFYLGLASVWTFVGQIGTSIHLSDTSIGNVLAISTIAGTIGSGIAAVLAGRVANLFLICVGMAAMLASCFGLIHVSTVLVFMVAAILFKFAWTFALPAMFETIASADASGSLLAFSSAGIGVGLMAGPSIAGGMITMTHGFAGMLLVAAVFCVCAWTGCLTLIRMNRHHGKH